MEGGRDGRVWRKTRNVAAHFGRHLTVHVQHPHENRRIHGACGITELGRRAVNSTTAVVGARFSVRFVYVTISKQVLNQCALLCSEIESWRGCRSWRTDGIYSEQTLLDYATRLTIPVI